ncbi:MAG: PH domain-containing protein [Nanoarchaeota archaeon]|nr:PH domain-containing protein [Nanoarchaeota archaeon]
MKNKLHSGAKWLFRIRGYFSLLIFFIFFGVAVIQSFIIKSMFGNSTGNSNNLFLVILLGIVLIIIIVEIYARMAYNRWFYEIEKNDIRLERGIIWKKYSNIPYERVQNVDIHRGVLARILGFSSIYIQTAGYSMPARGHGSYAEGQLPAVSIKNAEEIRDFVLKQARGKRQGI